ncbi:hypothetical protein D3C81_2293190 [compost metagenome]
MDHAYRLIVEAHGAVARDFQKVDTAQKGAFARPAGTDQANDVAGLCVQRNTLEDFVVAIAFMQVFYGQFVHIQAP